jgi:hypothetical protein
MGKGISQFMNEEQNDIRADIGEVVSDLSSQLAISIRDLAIQRSLINQLNKKIAELETK